jgi:hypothetical protein
LFKKLKRIGTYTNSAKTNAKIHLGHAPVCFAHNVFHLGRAENREVNFQRNWGELHVPTRHVGDVPKGHVEKKLLALGRGEVGANAEAANTQVGAETSELL